MKKAFSILMMIVLAVFLVACGEKAEIAEASCRKCGKTVAADAAFCADCGASLTDSTESKTESIESTPDNSSSYFDEDFYDDDFDYRGDDDYDYDYSYGGNSSIVSDSDEWEEPEHEHSFVPNITNPTCTDEGYTTYTCSCGDSYTDDYTEPRHTYAEHICSGCGLVEPSYTYEYLLNWYKDNGNETVTIKPYDGLYTYTLGYDEEKNALYFKERGEDSSYDYNSKINHRELIHVTVYLNSGNKFDYKFYHSNTMLRSNPYLYNNTYTSITGVIKGDEYSGGSLDYSFVSGDKDYLYSGLRAGGIMVCEMLDLLDEYFAENIPEISVEGLGFTAR